MSRPPEPRVPPGEPGIPSVCGDCIATPELAPLRRRGAVLVTAGAEPGRCVMCGLRIAPRNDEAPPRTDP